MAKISKTEKLLQTLNVEKVDGVEAPKQKTLAQMMNKFNNKKGDNLNKASLGSTKENVSRIPTNILALDYKLRGGIPRGRITFLAGKESSLKSTVCLRTIASVQKVGGLACYVDAERTFDPEWAKLHGVDLEKLVLLEPKTAEEAYNDMTYWILEGIDVVVLDSLNALAPRKEVFADEKGTEAANIEINAMGVAPKMMSQWLRTNTPRIHAAQTAFMVIGQIRSNLNAGPYGNPDTITGGQAIRFYSTILLETRQLTGKTNEIRDENDNVIGKPFEYKVSKNKLGKADSKIQFNVYGPTIDNYTSMLSVCLEEEIIQKPNNKTYICDGVSYNGKGAMIEALVNQSTGAYSYCEEKLREKMGSNIYYPNPYQKAQDIAAAKALPIHTDENGVLLTDEEISQLQEEPDVLEE